MTPDEYCQARAAGSGSSFYYSFLFLPPERRRAITAVYAFCREVDDVADEVSDPLVARSKLAWWRTEIAAVFAGAPQHPVARALVPVVTTFGLPQAHFQTVIDGMAMDLLGTRYVDFAQLESYCHRVAGVVGLLAAEIFGYTQPATRGYARDLGIALQLTNILRDVGEDARRGRVYLPQGDLARYGITASELLERRESAAFAAAFRAMMAEQVARARAWYQRALDQLPAEDRTAQRPGLMMAATYRALLEEIERERFAVLDQRIALTPMRKLWIAWKASRER